jgi:hypothetical protein
MNMFLWVIDFLMLIMSVVLLMGKGSGLIAGYNKSSEKAKSKFDEKKLCRTMGGGLLVLTVLLAAMLFMNFEISNKIIEYIFIGLFIADILMMFILGNTVCKRKQP